MANKKQLEILEQGVEVWNKWREEYPGVEPDLTHVSLRETNLAEAYLARANLTNANLTNADLTRTDLTCANLTRADLTHAALAGARLVQANLSATILTGAWLYGIAQDDWTIDNVKCDFVYWDRKPLFRTRKDVEFWELMHRIPKDRDFRPGEFEELYAHLPTFGYYFKHGFTALDAVVMARIVEAINEEYPEFELKLDSFHSRGQPHAKFTVHHKEYIKKASQEIEHGYETRIQALEGQMEEIQKRFALLGERPQMLISHFTVSGGEVTMGTKHIGRDSITISGNAQVNEFTTGAGDTFQGNYAQKLLQSTTPQSSQEDIVKLLSFVQQELPKLPLPEGVKEEVANEVKSAEIQAKKEQPDKQKVATRLKNATDALKESANSIKEAVTIGNLLGQAILWCGDQWIEWM